MRKLIFNICLVVIVLLLSFSNLLKVDADEGSHSYIYHITSLNIDTDNKIMEFEGFAFIDHMDNYGNSNLETHIIASSSAGSKSYLVEYLTSNPTKLDYYFARCQSNEACTNSHALAVKNAFRGSTDCNRDNFADCAYFDVDFKVTIDLQELYEDLGSNGEEIEFSIATYNSLGVSAESSLGVYRGICKVDGRPGICGNRVSFNGSTIGISTSDSVIVTVTDGRVRYNNDGFGYTGTYYTQFSQFSVSSYGNASFNKNGNAFNSNYFVIQNGRYIIYDSWVKASHALKINFGGEPIEYVEPDASCDPGYDKNMDISSITCGNSKQIKGCVKTAVSFNATYDLTAEQINQTRHPDTGAICGDTTDLNVNHSSVYTLVHQGGNFSFDSVSGSVYAGRGFTFPSLVYDNYIYWKYPRNGLGQIIYPNFWVNYGKWVVDHYEDHGYFAVCNPVTNTTIYGTPCAINERYWVSHMVPVLTCDADGNTYRLNVHSDKVDVSEFGEAILKENLEKVSSKNVKNSIIDVNNYSNEIMNGSGTGGGVVSSAYPSNKFSNSLEMVDGDWHRYGSNWAVGVLKEGSENRYSSNYKFSMYDAYVRLIEGSGENVADVKYSNVNLGDNYHLVGKKYFVPLLFPDSLNFLIKLSAPQLSFIRGIDWRLDGTCDINVVNKIFNCQGSTCSNKFIYRSIDLGDPFPDGNVPRNWIGYNRKRIADTYKNGVVYEVALINGNSDDDKLGTEMLNEIDTNYNSWDTIDIDGSNSFINSKFNYYFKKNANNSYCPIGFYNLGCDKYGSG